MFEEMIILFMLYIIYLALRVYFDLIDRKDEDWI